MSTPDSPNSEIKPRNGVSPSSHRKVAVHAKKKPRVHIIIVHGNDLEARRHIAIPREEGDMSKTFEAALRNVPLMLSDIRFAVVIYGEEVVKYSADVFTWLCGAGPDPNGRDPNWMGGKPTFEGATGRTTRQIIGAPHGAIFIWCNGELSHPKNLALQYGRDDLTIVSPSWLEGVGLARVRNAYRGLDLVLDHACRLSSNQREVFTLNEAKRTRRKPG